MKSKRNRPIAWCALLTAAVLLLSSCSGDLPLNHRMIVQNAGVDEIDGEFTLSVNAYLADRSAPGEEENAEDVFFSRSGNSVTNAVEQIGLTTGREPYFPHNQAVVIGQETAENGIGAALSFFMEFYECRGSVPLFIAQGDAEALLSCVGKDGSVPTRELAALSQSGVQNGSAVYAEVFTAAQCLIDGERDFCVPVLRTEQTGENVRVLLDGTALFSGEKMVALLGERETQGVLLAAGTAQNMSLGLTVSAENAGSEFQVQAAVKDIKTTVRCKVENDAVQISIAVTCSASATEWDFAAQPTMDEAMIAVLRESCENELVQRVEAAIRICAQENGSDPFGFGRRLAQQEAQWWRENREIWRQLLPECDFSVTVDCNFKAGGMQPAGQKGKS